MRTLADPAQSLAFEPPLAVQIRGLARIEDVVAAPFPSGRRRACRIPRMGDAVCHLVHPPCLTETDDGRPSGCRAITHQHDRRCKRSTGLRTAPTTMSPHLTLRNVLPRMHEACDVAHSLLPRRVIPPLWREAGVGSLLLGMVAVA
jgi:hypothetical protein